MSRNAETLLALPTSGHDELNALLDRAVELKTKAAQYDAVRKRIIELIREEGLTDAHGNFGARHGANAAFLTQRSGSRRLNKEKLLQYMSTAELETCYDAGDPYDVVELGVID